MPCRTAHHHRADDPTGTVVVAVRGEVDGITCAVLHDQLFWQLRLTHHLVLDLGGVDFLCAAGLTVLVALEKTARQAGAVLCVVARNRQVCTPLTITGLSAVLDLHLDVAGAVVCEHAAPASPPARSRLAAPRRPGDLR
ncbi:STAS domain-containing protein [Lentzea chajnantorensis]